MLKLTTVIYIFMEITGNKTRRASSVEDISVFKKKNKTNLGIVHKTYLTSK